MRKISGLPSSFCSTYLKMLICGDMVERHL
jgi:hypothetical protein